MRILNTLLEITIYATVIFALTMLVKRLLKDRLSPFLHYAIWSLFILRLMLPVTIKSPVQVFTLPTPKTQTNPVTVQMNDSGEEPPFRENTPISEAENEVHAANPASAAQAAPMQVGTFRTSQTPSISIYTVLLAAWLAGAGIGVAYIIFLYVRLQKRLAKHAVRPSKHLRALYREVRDELTIKTKVPLICAYGLGSPGILFPACVLMPMEALAAMNDNQVKNALRHELTHYKRGDQATSMLLSLLNAIYWFNPIVWLAAKEIRADMETACDSRVVRNMSAAQKGSYATLILELFSRCRYRQVVLGMAKGTSKSVVEQRIRGVFMNQKSECSAKIACLILVLTLLVGCFTTACVPKTQSSVDAAITGSEDGPVEIQVFNNAAPEEKATETAEPTPTPAPELASPLARKLGMPAHWKEEMQSADGKLLLHADLDVTLPETTAIPIASAVCREVTEADLKNVATLFFGPDVSFTYAVQDTKEYAKAYVEKNKEVYDKVIAGTNENMIPSFVKSVTKQYESMQEQANSAPSAAEKVALLPVFTKMMRVTGDSYMGFRGVATLNGTDYLVSAANTGRASAVNIFQAYEDYFLTYAGTYRSEPEGLSTTKEQAVELASAMASKIDGGLSLSRVMTVGLPPNQENSGNAGNHWAWQCVFMREVNGVGTIYDSRDVGSDIDSNVEGRANEALEITVDDRGVCNIHWMNPMTVETVIESDAALLPFDAITNMLPDLMREKYDYDITREVNPAHDLYIEHAELGLMRVGKPGSTTYKLEPVWSFFISFEEQPDYSAPYLREAAYGGDPVRWNSLTISAIDGRVINRDRGE